MVLEVDVVVAAVILLVKVPWVVMVSIKVLIVFLFVASYLNLRVVSAGGEIGFDCDQLILGKWKVFRCRSA